MRYNDKVLQATVTGEPVQPVRLYYRVIDKARLLSRFENLGCMNFDPDQMRWVWFYEYESSGLKFVKSHESIPHKWRPLTIGSFFFHNRNEIVLDLRSFDRAINAVVFFDKHLGRDIAELTHAAVVNRFFSASEMLDSSLDKFFNSPKMVEIDPEKELAKFESLAKKHKQKERIDWKSMFKEKAGESLPEIEKFPVYFYEDGIKSFKVTLHMRAIVAFEHWNGNTDYSMADVARLAASRL